MTRIRIGTQGWNYDAWVGPFYPRSTRPSDYLSVYSRGFDTVEVDATFYAIPPAKTLRGWAERVPDGFAFALKLPQEISHENRLRNSTDLAAQFFERIRELGDKLGPVLVQLSPDFSSAELPSLVSFLPLLPRDLRVAIEFRQRSWIQDGVLALLAEHNVALSLSDGRWIPRKVMLALAARPTADFAYLRWMGQNRDLIDYSRVQIDRGRETDAWCKALASMPASAGTAFGYVNNYFAGHAPESGRLFQRSLGLASIEPSELGDQMSLF